MSDYQTLTQKNEARLPELKIKTEAAPLTITYITIIS